MVRKPAFSIAFAPNPRSRPIMDGTVRPEGIELIPTASGPAETFHRQLTHQEFDVSEMSLSSLAIITAQGNRDWVTLPICTTRTFFGIGALIRTDAGIESPADLKGKRVGVNEYQQTAALWARGFFQHEYGVAPTDVEWWMERTQELSHGGATGFQPPPGVALHYMDPAKDQNLGGMMANGELDAIYVLLLRRWRNQPEHAGPARPRAGADALPRPPRGVGALLRQDGRLPHQPRRHHAALALRAVPVGRAQPVRRVREGKGNVGRTDAGRGPALRRRRSAAIQRASRHRH